MWRATLWLLDRATTRNTWLAMLFVRPVHRAWVRRGSRCEGRLFELLCAVSP